MKNLSFASHIFSYSSRFWDWLNAFLDLLKCRALTLYPSGHTRSVVMNESYIPWMTFMMGKGLKGFEYSTRMIWIPSLFFWERKKIDTLHATQYSFVYVKRLCWWMWGVTSCTNEINHTYLSPFYRKTYGVLWYIGYRPATSSTPYGKTSNGKNTNWRNEYNTLQESIKHHSTLEYVGIFIFFCNSSSHWLSWVNKKVTPPSPPFTLQIHKTAIEGSEISFLSKLKSLEL